MSAARSNRMGRKLVAAAALVVALAGGSAIACPDFRPGDVTESIQTSQRSTVTAPGNIRGAGVRVRVPEARAQSSRPVPQLPGSPLGR